MRGLGIITTFSPPLRGSSRDPLIKHLFRYVRVARLRELMRQFHPASIEMKREKH